MYELRSSELELVDSVLEELGLVKVLIIYRLLLRRIQRSYLVLYGSIEFLLVHAGYLQISGHQPLSSQTSTVLEPSRCTQGHSPLCSLDEGRHLVVADVGASAPEGDQADLVEDVQMIQMILVHN